MNKRPQKAFLMYMFLNNNDALNYIKDSMSERDTHQINHIKHKKILEEVAEFKAQAKDGLLLASKSEDHLLA